MISRKTTLKIAEAYVTKFSGGGGQYPIAKVSGLKLYDFLYANDFSSWVCNAARAQRYPRNHTDWVLRLHTGESLTNATQDWSWEQRQALGQQYLHGIAEAFLQWYEMEAEGFYRTAYHKVTTSSTHLN